MNARKNLVTSETPKGYPDYFAHLGKGRGLLLLECYEWSHGACHGAGGTNPNNEADGRGVGRYPARNHKPPTLPA